MRINSIGRAMLAPTVLAVFVVVSSVDISPQAYEMLVAKGSAAWVSNVYFT